MKRAVVWLFLAAAACGKKAPPPLCEPWKGYGIPAPDGEVHECRDWQLMASYKTLTGDALYAAVGDAFKKAGFQQVTNGRPEDAGNQIYLRAKDKKQYLVRPSVYGLEIDENHDSVTSAAPEQVMAKVQALRATFEPLAKAFPATDGKDRACDDDELLRIDPTLRDRVVGFFDVDELLDPSHPPSASIGTWAVPPLPKPGDTEGLARVDSGLAADATRLVVIGYRIATADDARANGGASFQKDERGIEHEEGTFQPGLVAADLVVFDKPDARPLCWTHVVATSSDTVTKGPNEHGDKLAEDLQRHIDAETALALGRISKVLKP